MSILLRYIHGLVVNSFKSHIIIESPDQGRNHGRVTLKFRLEFLIVVFVFPPSMLQDRREEASEILRKIYPPHEVEREIEALRLSVEAEIAEEGSLGDGNIFTRIRKAWSNIVVRRGLVAGIGCQVAQQFVGINTVMYYSPTIVQLAGYASNKTALALSLITSGLNAIGSIVSMFFVDRFGRRKLLLFSLVGIILMLGLLTGIFVGAEKHSPAISSTETAHFGNNTCPNYKAASSESWSCMRCLKASSDCAFCAHQGNKVTNKPFYFLVTHLSSLLLECKLRLLKWFLVGKEKIKFLECKSTPHSFTYITDSHV